MSKVNLNDLSMEELMDLVEKKKAEQKAAAMPEEQDMPIMQPEAAKEEEKKEESKVVAAEAEAETAAAQVEESDEEEEEEGFFAKLGRKVRNGFRSDEEEAKLDAQIHELTHAPDQKYNGQFITEVEHKCDGKLIEQILKINPCVFEFQSNFNDSYQTYAIELAVENNLDLRPYCKTYDIDGKPTRDKSRVMRIDIRDASEHGLINYTSFGEGGRLKRGYWTRILNSL